MPFSIPDAWDYLAAFQHRMPLYQTQPIFNLPLLTRQMPNQCREKLSRSFQAHLRRHDKKLISEKKDFAFCQLT
jgi:hypothetical protein